jgi:hypothetical protein
MTLTPSLSVLEDIHHKGKGTSRPRSPAITRGNRSSKGGKGKEKNRDAILPQESNMDAIQDENDWKSEVRFVFLDFSFNFSLPSSSHCLFFRISSHTVTPLVNRRMFSVLVF